MLLKAQNSVIIKDQPQTILTASVDAAGVTLTCKNTGGFTANDFALIGKLGQEKTEIKLISAVATVTSLTVAASSFAHDIDTPVTKIDYDKVRFYRGTTAVFADASALAAAQVIDPTEEFSYYEDATNTTGYGFCKFYDSNGDGYSVESDAIPYTGYTALMLREIRKKVRRLINEPDETLIEDEEINDEINLAQDEIAHSRLWSWYENTKSFSSVAEQYEYDLATNVFTLYEAKYETQPLAVIDLHRWNILRWDSNTTGDPTHICMWNKKARVYPYPSSSADATAIDDADDITAADTTIISDDNSAFSEQGRIIIDSEVISYTGKDDDTDFTGCTRAEEGTTAAIHLNNAAITKRDFIYHLQEDPADLDDETDATEIPNPSVLAYKAGAELALRKDDQVLHDRLLAKYDRGYRQLVKADNSKYKSTFGRVKESSEVISDYGVIRNPNNPPQTITE